MPGNQTQPEGFMILTHMWVWDSGGWDCLLLLGNLNTWIKAIPMLRRELFPHKYPHQTHPQMYFSWKDDAENPEGFYHIAFSFQWTHASYLSYR